MGGGNGRSDAISYQMNRAHERNIKWCCLVQCSFKTKLRRMFNGLNSFSKHRRCNRLSCARDMPFYVYVFRPGPAVSLVGEFDMLYQVLMRIMKIMCSPYIASRSSLNFNRLTKSTRLVKFRTFEK